MSIVKKKRYYFIRHGQTDYNKLRIVQGSGIDSELNEVGRLQAESFYMHYKNVGFDYVICSTLKRSYQTVKPFLKSLHIPFEKTSLINEISWGIHEGQKGSLEMKNNYSKMVTAWGRGDFDYSLPEAESANQLSSRLQQFLNYLVDLPYREVLICTHGRSLRCLLCLMKGQHLSEMEKYNHSNTGLFYTEYEEGIFTFLKENDIKHLEELDISDHLLGRNSRNKYD